MKELLHTPDKLSQKYQAPDNTITRKRRMILRTKLWLKKQYTLPSIVVMTGLATRKSKPLIQVQAHTSISPTQCIARWRRRCKIGTRRKERNKKSKELSWVHLERIPTDSLTHGLSHGLAQIQANTQRISLWFRSKRRRSTISILKADLKHQQGHWRRQRRSVQRRIASLPLEQTDSRPTIKWLELLHQIGLKD